MSTLDKEMDIARHFFETHRKGSKSSDPCFFKMSHLRSLNGERKFNRQAIFYSNMDEPELEQSLDLLRQALELYGPTASQYILLSLVKSESSNNDYVLTITNPYYYGNISGGNMMMMNQFQQPNILEMQRQMYEMKSDYEKRIAAMEREKELQELRDEIDEIRGSKNSTIDKINGFAETEVGMKVIDALLGLIPKAQAQQIPTQQIQQQQAHVQQQQEQAQAQQQQQQASSQDIQEMSNRISGVLQKVSQVFPEDYLQALEDFANFCIKNPNMAINLREKIGE